MSENPQGGRHIGTATATIRVVIEGLAAAKSQLAAGAAGMKGAFKGAADGADDVGRAFDRSTKRAGTGLGTIREKINSLREEALSLSVIAGGIVFGGIRAAKSLADMQTGLRAVLGSAEAVKKVNAEILAISKEFNQPILQVTEGARAFATITRSTGIGMREMLITAQQLVALDPAQGFEGAARAVRELISGDDISLRDRFELNKTDTAPLRELAKSGDIKGALDGLRELLNAKGFTEESLKELGQSGMNAFALMQDAIQRLMASAFMPFLQNVLIPLVNKFTEFVESLNTINPAIVQVGVGFTLAVAAAGPLVLALGKIVEMYTTLKALSTTTTLGTGLAKLGAGAAGVAAGAFIGQKVATGLADREIGDQRLRSDSGENFWDVMGERIKQIIVIFTNELFEFAKVIGVIAVYVRNAIDQFLNVFRLGGAALGIIFNELAKVFSQLMIGFADAASGLFDTTDIRKAGQRGVAVAESEIATGKQEIQRVTTELMRGFEPPPGEVDRVTNNIESMRQSVVGGLMDMLFPVAPAVQEVADEVEEAANKIKGITFETDQIDAFINFQEDLAAIEKEGQANREKEARAYEERRTEAETRFAEQRAQAIANQIRQEGKDRVALEKQIERQQADAQKQAQEQEQEDAEKERQARQKANEANEKNEADHKAKLLELDRQHRLTLLQAASKLDARAVWAELQAQKEREQQEKDTYQKRKTDIQTQLDEQLQQMRVSREAQRLEQAAALEAQIAEQRAALEERHAMQREDMNYQYGLQQEQHARELEKMQQDHAQRLSAIDMDIQNQRQRRETAFVEEFNRLAKSEDQKLAVQRMGQDQALKLLEAYWKNHNAIMQRNTAAKPPVPGAYNKAPTQGPVQGPVPRPAPGTSTPKPAPVIGPGGVVYMDTGGTIRRRGWYNLQAGEEVIRPEIAEQFRRMMGGNFNQQGLLAAFGRASSNIMVDKIENHYGDIGNRSDRAVSELTENAVISAFLKALKR